MALTPAPAPRKRAKLDTFAASLDELISQLQTINSSLASDSAPSHSSLIRELNSLTLKREAFEGSLRRVKKQLEEVEQSKDWREELDRDGVELWNRSTALKDSWDDFGSATENDKAKEVIALIRLNAFKIIRLGAPEPLEEKDHVALLALSTKTYTALSSSTNLAAADDILSVGAEHCASISLGPPLDGSQGARASPPLSTVRIVLAHYTTRITLSIQSGKMGVAEWIKSKIKDELFGFLQEREICKVANTAHEAGRWMLASKARRESSSSAADEGESAKALPWLLWAFELLEGVQGEASEAMKINVLSVLVEAYLDPSAGSSRLEKADQTLIKLLRLQPTAALWRRRIKLLVARSAGDGEITRAFVEASTAVTPWTEDEGARLLQELHKLPDNRRSLKSGVYEALVDVAIQMQQREACNRDSMSEGSASTSSISPTSPFLAQVVMSAVLSIKSGPSLHTLFEHISGAAPSFQLDPQSAFLCTTYIWRSADKAHAQGKTEEAAELCLLCTKPMLAAMKETTWSKSFRKAALCYGELKKYDEAEKSIAHDSSAKGRFLRLYNLIGNARYEEAAALIEAMVSAEGFYLQLLLWTAKAAQEAGSDPLLSKVLECLITYSARHEEAVVGVDCMVLFRQLIRLLMYQLSDEEEEVNAELLSLLRGHFAAALKLATRLSKQTPIPEKLAQGVAWLYRIGYNLCTRFINNPALGSSSCSFFGVIASLIELETSLSTSTNPKDLATLMRCRLVALTEDLNSARAASTTTSAGVDAYKKLLSHLDKLETDCAELSRGKPRNEQLERTRETLGALKLEAFAALGDWGRALELAEADSSVRTEKSIKILAQKAVEDDSCPPAIVLEILKATLKNLFGRGDLDTIRLMAGLLLEDKPDEAFEYFSIAVSFLASLSSYPIEEQSWLTISAWDKGIDAFTGHHPSAGHQWCSLALRLARSSQAPLLAKQMENDYKSLCEKFPEDGEEEMRG
ncbi:hypothetical protein BCR35DRAFT_332925 [Leucosporidium creatinivorum]|uniref:Protein ZIP4 homolog n=1 Tax=Leucosporidium creatinivorum TaxID=106004 RepID=A0A1Y2EWJ1_9BASI|nr:hypothetical protein BCR35DRAFT_332925 [Leucosporidium creatinivorum]